MQPETSPIFLLLDQYLLGNLRGHVPNFTYARDFQFSKATVYQYSKE